MHRWALHFSTDLKIPLLFFHDWMWKSMESWNMFNKLGLFERYLWRRTDFFLQIVVHMKTITEINAYSTLFWYDNSACFYKRGQIDIIYLFWVPPEATHNKDSHSMNHLVHVKMPQRTQIVYRLLKRPYLSDMWHVKNFFKHFCALKQTLRNRLYSQWRTRAL